MAAKSLKDLGDQLKKIDKQLETSRSTKKKDATEMDPHNLNIILIALHKSVEIIKEMTEKGQDNCPRVASLEERTRVLEDRATTTTRGPSRASLSSPHSRTTISSRTTRS